MLLMDGWIDRRMDKLIDDDDTTVVWEREREREREREKQERQKGMMITVLNTLSRVHSNRLQ
jgi:hypothetical protein